MPVQPCRENGKPGYKFGTKGRCNTYELGDKQSRERAKKKAAAQGGA